jgi:uncharacterized protein involved in response to NO
VGGFLLPLALRGEAAPDVSRSATGAVAGYAAAGLAVVAGLLLQDAGEVRGGLALRAAAAIAVLGTSGAWRPPTRPGYNRRLLWASVWCLPLGLGLAAWLPEHRIAAMHVAYVGGFGILAFSVATHVTLGHSGDASAQAGRPWPVTAFGALFLAALAARSLMAAISLRYFEWLGIAAALWITGALVWAAYLVPKMWRRPLQPEA